MDEQKEITKRKIVLVEDDRDACEILTRVLTEAGYMVEPMTEGRMLLEPTAGLPDLYILDNSIPTIEGVALCKYLKLQPPARQIPVLIISGDHQIADKAFRAGAAYFLGKPFDIPYLLRAVHGLLSEN